MQQGQQRTPLLSALRRYVRRCPAVFHVPGHQQGAGADRAWASLIGRAALRVDLTEAIGLDDLHAPGGAIAAAQDLAAAASGAERSLFLVGGTTVGLQAAILATAGPGDTVLLPRHAHRSVLGALFLSGAHPQYLMPEYDHELGIPLLVSPAELQRAAAVAPRPRAAVVIHPTYFGFCGPTSALAAAAHRCGLVVIADEAHGAHFLCHPHLPPTALECGADIAVQSLHKTGGSLTQSSLLHLRRDGEAFQESLLFWLRTLQSSSPSYLLMASLDAARRLLAKKGEILWTRALATADQVRTRLATLDGLRCVSLGDLPAPVRPNLSQDPTKLLIDVRERQVTGYEAAAALWRAGVAVELAGPGYVLALITPFHRRQDVDRLVRGLAGLRGHRRRRPVSDRPLGAPPLPEVVLSPAEAIRRPRHRVTLASAIGALAAEVVAPYPPGVPILAPGERVTLAVVEYIRRACSLGTHFQGPADLSLATLNVVKE